MTEMAIVPEKRTTVITTVRDCKNGKLESVTIEGRVDIGDDETRYAHVDFKPVEKGTDKWTGKMWVSGIRGQATSAIDAGCIKQLCGEEDDTLPQDVLQYGMTELMARIHNATAKVQNRGLDGAIESVL